MSPNQIFKASYHLIAALVLLFIVFRIQSIPMYIKGALCIILLSHLYDTWWFFNYDGNAPI